MAALVKLGYSQITASDIVARVAQVLDAKSEPASLDVLIRESLRQLAR